jgi:hypothetical protein
VHFVGLRVSNGILVLRQVAPATPVTFTSRSVALLTYKGKVHPRTGDEGRDGEWRHGSTLSLTLALNKGGCSTPRPGRFTPRNDPVRIVQEAGWAPGPVWTGAENLAHHRDSIPGPSSL